MRRKHLFAQITKVDVAARTVTGIAMQEIVDRTNEKCLYEESKPFFQAWSDSQFKASNGKSKGNVREMHQPSAVGRVVDLTCDDALKAFIVTTEIDDDTALMKCEKGTYTGFSIGANFAKDADGKPMKQKVNGVLEWVADPVEVSVVDIPCVPTALFEYKDAAGHVEMRKFARTKSMYTISEFASLLSSVNYMLQDMDYELQWEGDGSNVPDRVREWLQDGVEIFQDVVTEETSEFAARFAVAKAAVADRQKASSGCGCDCTGCSDCGKKKSAQPQHEDDELTPEQTKALTDAAEQMKAVAEIVKALPAQLEAVKTIAEGTKVVVDAQETRLKALESDLTELAAISEKLAAEPQQSKVTHPAAVVTREKAAEAGAGEVKEEPKTPLEKMKALQAEGVQSGSGFPA